MTKASSHSLTHHQVYGREDLDGLVSPPVGVGKYRPDDWGQVAGALKQAHLSTGGQAAGRQGWAGAAGKQAGRQAGGGGREVAMVKLGEVGMTQHATMGWLLALGNNARSL